MEKTLVMKRECIAEKGIWTASDISSTCGITKEFVITHPSLEDDGIVEAVEVFDPAPCRNGIKESLDIAGEGIEYAYRVYRDYLYCPSTTSPEQVASSNCQ